MLYKNSIFLTASCLLDIDKHFLVIYFCEVFPKGEIEKSVDMRGKKE